MLPSPDPPLRGAWVRREGTGCAWMLGHERLGAVQPAGVECEERRRRRPRWAEGHPVPPAGVWEGSEWWCPPRASSKAPSRNLSQLLAASARQERGAAGAGVPIPLPPPLAAGREIPHTLGEGLG